MRPNYNWSFDHLKDSAEDVEDVSMQSWQYKWTWSSAAVLEVDSWLYDASMSQDSTPFNPFWMLRIWKNKAVSSAWLQRDWLNYIYHLVAVKSIKPKVQKASMSMLQWDFSTGFDSGSRLYNGHQVATQYNRLL